MAKAIIGSFFGTATKDVDLVPIFRENELEIHSDSFLKTEKLIVKKIAIAAPAGTKFIINDSEFLMPGNSFELAWGIIDIGSLKFVQDTVVTIVYAY